VSANAPDSPQGERRLQSYLGIRLMPGVRPVNMAAFYIAVLFSTLVFAFMTQAQPLLLTTTLGVEAARAGGVGGGIVLWGSWVVILCVGLFGALSDKLGRLPVFALGFLLMGLCCFLHPQAERVGAELGRLLPGEAQLDGVAGLLALRLLYAVGVAAAIAMLPTVLADYAVDSDRGRATGIRTVMGGMGALLATGALLQLPKLLVSLGFDSQAALRFTYQAAAYLIFAVALFLCLFLQRRTLAQAQRRESVWEITREGLRAARDPGVALAYGGAFLARAPLAMFGAFFALWSKQRGLDIGLGPEETSLAFIVAIVFALLGAPIFGLMADRLNRVTALVLACTVAALGYGSTWFIQDPLGLELPGLLGDLAVAAVAALIGFGAVGCEITSAVLIAQQAPGRVRGAVIGFFSLSGAVGIVVAGSLGDLFGGWHPTGPFLVFAALSVVVALWALLVRNRVVSLRELGEPVAG